MALFKFEGDFDILAEVQVQLVESALQNQGFKGGEVLVEPVVEKGDNFTAHVKRFIYKADDGSTFKMIGKVAPVPEETRFLMRTRIMFYNEIITAQSYLNLMLYKTLLVLLRMKE